VFKICSCQHLNSLPSPSYFATRPTLLAHNTCKWTLKQVLQSDPFLGRYWWLLSKPKLYEKGLYQFILSMAHFPFFVKAQPMWLPVIVKVKQRYKVAKLQARIKPTALCSVIDKENSIEFLLDLLHYIYNYYCGYTSCLPWSSCYLSADFFVICCDCDLWLHVCVTWLWCDHSVTLWLSYDISHTLS